MLVGTIYLSLHIECLSLELAMTSKFDIQLTMVLSVKAIFSLAYVYMFKRFICRAALPLVWIWRFKD